MSVVSLMVIFMKNCLTYTHIRPRVCNCIIKRSLSVIRTKPIVYALTFGVSVGVRSSLSYLQYNLGLIYISLCLCVLDLNCYNLK